jgi:hypothetical protein
MKIIVQTIYSDVLNYYNKLIRKNISHGFLYLQGKGVGSPARKL